MPATPETSADSVDGSLALHWLMPLHYFYEKRQMTLPPLAFMDGPEMPSPWNELLVHERDMTPTLADHHGTPLSLEVLDKEQSDDYLLRLVILRRKDTLMPVECGAIGIHLSMFKDHARELVQDCRIPLGAILQDEKVAHYGRPRGFFKVEADTLMSHALGENDGVMLYGRCNELCDPDGMTIADVVEVLPRKV